MRIYNTCATVFPLALAISARTWDSSTAFLSPVQLCPPNGENAWTWMPFSAQYLLSFGCWQTGFSSTYRQTDMCAGLEGLA